MGKFIDFADLKQKVPFAKAIELLKLDAKRSGNQWRGACPSCNTGGDRALVVTDGKGYFCFADHKGGDQIALASHVLGIPAKEAAQELAQRAGIVPVQGTSTVRDRVQVPEREGGGGSKLSPLSYLECEHDAVIALGFDPVFCAEQGIGYAPRGVVRGSVAIPFRDQHGTLLGYIGVQDVTYIPPNFTSNVVAFKKTG